jgi:hypothetical protein
MIDRNVTLTGARVIEDYPSGAMFPADVARSLSCGAWTALHELVFGNRIACSKYWRSLEAGRDVGTPDAVLREIYSPDRSDIIHGRIGVGRLNPSGGLP